MTPSVVFSLCVHWSFVFSRFGSSSFCEVEVNVKLVSPFLQQPPGSVSLRQPTD